jgi:glycosyltransferase involved in cell wall biosynthesis
LAGIDLTVITATWQHPKHLARTIRQVAESQHRLDCEHIIVSDGPDSQAETFCRLTGVRYVALPERAKAWGAACKDAGIAVAAGEYVCFWDDDNDYFPEALAVLYANTYGVDIGIAQCWHRGAKVIPHVWNGKFIYGEIDTMCVCVRTSLARRELWYHAAEAEIRGTDFRWFSRLLQHAPIVRFLPVVIGHHL